MASKLAHTNHTVRLPSYDKPPVIEVIASVQFEPLPNLKMVHLGLLWQRFRQAFPKTEQKAPLQPIVERLGVREPLAQMQFTVLQEPDIPRTWFVNEAGDELIQVQTDRFIRNWRAVPTVGGPYPRFEKFIRPRFLEDYQVFQEFLQSELGAGVDLNQCELTYVNHIRPNTLWNSHKDVAAVFVGWNGEYADLLEQPVEAVNLNLVHTLNDERGAFIGRLRISLQSAFRAAQQPSEPDEPIFVLTITARGRPSGEGAGGVSRFLDIAHRAIVLSFDRITTPEMHKVWGKNEP